MNALLSKGLCRDRRLCLGQVVLYGVPAVVHVVGVAPVHEVLDEALLRSYFDLIHFKFGNLGLISVVRLLDKRLVHCRIERLLEVALSHLSAVPKQEVV